MNWRTSLTPAEITRLVTLETELRKGYNKTLECERQALIECGQLRAKNNFA